MTDVTVLLAFTAGLLSFLSPCVLPLVPSYLSFVTGMSLQELQQETRPRGRVLLHALAFVGGFSAVFVALGLSISSAGRMLLDYREAIQVVGGLLILVLGVHLLGVLPLRWLMRSRQLHLTKKPAGVLGSMAVGVTFAMAWTPCIGPILGAILTLAGSAETVRTGAAMLVAYSLGLAVPFVFAAVGLAKFLRLFTRYRHVIPLFERSAGALLIAVGTLMLTGQWTRLNSYAISLTPTWLLERL